MEMSVQDTRVRTELLFTDADIPEFLKCGGLGEWRSDGNHGMVLDTVRLRANIYRDRRGRKAVCRVLPDLIPDSKSIGIPARFMEAILGSRDGLVIVSGATGSGKSTTMASAIQTWIENNDGHVLTIEDPIEYLLNGKTPLQVSQREVGRDVASFAMGINSGVRQAPRLIFIGEMKDAASTLAALDAALTGHLVLATTHTGRVSTTVETILRNVPDERRSYASAVLPRILRGMLCQQLVKSEKGGRVALHELLMPSQAVINHISSGQYSNLDGDLEQGAQHGSFSFLQSIRAAKSLGHISMQRALDLEARLDTKGSSR